MEIIKYPMAVKHNKETGELNGWIADLTILARGKTPQEMKQQARNYMKEFFINAIANEAKIPMPTPTADMIAKWKASDGYAIDYLVLEIT